MDVENQRMMVRVNNFNISHFESLGYIVKINDNIEIKISELSIGSGLKIDVVCKYCNNPFQKAYRRYLETKNDLCCSNCKMRKVEITNLKRYGNKCSMRNEEVLAKSKKKNMEKLGVEYPFQNKEILKKCVESSIEKYGVGHVTKRISKQQRHFYKLYGGLLNHFCSPYFLDIFFEKEKIYFEYDGGGHELNIKLGHLTKDEFKIKQENRSKFLKNFGYKEFRIISMDDVLSSDKILIDIKKRAFYLLINKSYNKYVYNLNTKTESFEE